MSCSEKELANNIWHNALVPPNLTAPLLFPRRNLLTPHFFELLPGGAILDPFLGMGTPTKVARALAREYGGDGIQPIYHEIAFKRPDEPLHLWDPIIATYEKVPLEEPPRTKAVSGEDVKELRLWDKAVLTERSASYGQDRAA